MGNHTKHVQITEELFAQLVWHFCIDDQNPDRRKYIENELQKKLDKIINHNLYTDYKTADAEEVREKARQEYLDRVGMRESFRWSKEYDKERR